MCKSGPWFRTSNKSARNSSSNHSFHHRYLTFQPVMYLMKLSIEMNMADLIAKIAKSSSRRRLGHHEQPFTETFNLPTPLPSSLMCSGLPEADSAARRLRSPTGTGQSCSSKEPDMECSVWDGCAKCRLGMPSLTEAGSDEDEGQENRRKGRVSIKREVV